MHVITFIFICIELVIFFFLIIYCLARPKDKIAALNSILIFLLITYNITGGLLPDPKLPGSFFIQEAIAYATGFIVPCFFPYYVYRAFKLTKMEFHAKRGIFLFLMLPYFIFIVTLAAYNDLEKAKNLLILPVLYAVWVNISLFKAIKYKYKNDFSTKASKEELSILLLSISPWIGLPIIDFFNIGQAIEVTFTNGGFLLLFALQVKTYITELRAEHKLLIETKNQLLNWNVDLKNEVDKRTKELAEINEQRTNNFINLVHETKTPLTVINHYLEEYVSNNGASKELDIIKGGINKLTRDIVSLFDVERFKRGIDVYNHNQILDFSQMLNDSLALFEYYCENRNISLIADIEESIFIKADINGINRIVNNLVENAIKFSDTGGEITITLKSNDNKIIFSVKDTGVGIAPHMQKRIFEPYFQINNRKTNLQGMGLGLPIVKKVVDSLNGQIAVNSNPTCEIGTLILVTFNRHFLTGCDVINNTPTKVQSLIFSADNFDVVDTPFIQSRKTILLIEDHKEVLHFIFKKLSDRYNVFCAPNGSDALKKLEDMPVIPDLILSDIMMDKMDGLSFAKVLCDLTEYSHVPIIFITAKSGTTDKIKALRAGGIDFIQKPFSFDELNQKIETILNCIYKQKTAFLMASIANLKAPILQEQYAATVSSSVSFEETCKQYSLTNREIQLVKHIHNGSSYRVIGENLYIAESTVKKHIQNMFEKVGVDNKIELLKKFPL